jgi:hypothetical protein
MYYVLVAAFMLVLPVGSIAFEAARLGTPVGAVLVAKWFVFWSVGCRLLLAGFKQIVDPRFTANILGTRSEDALVVVRELGFSNVALGLLGVLSLFKPEWRLGAALAGGVFYAFAGGMHVLNGKRNVLENVAMTSDLFAALVLLAACGIAVFAK